MKRILAFVAGGLLLTLPVYLGLANLRPLEDLFVYHDAWKAFEPLFLLGDVVGIHGHGTIVEATMFVVSCAIALAIVALLSTGVTQMRRQRKSA
ncbi:hypothetical protein [Trinickia acidisoli]|uniref:hypothetical protein n=1 Tax=Trinickia acidisoli TaxID=2767482 RepID=UPI001A8D9A32|nr:hypothetical protein [Trinickia acidisoli]